jgi:hypothetical protein
MDGTGKGCLNWIVVRGGEVYSLDEEYTHFTTLGASVVFRERQVIPAQKQSWESCQDLVSIENH